MRFERWLFAVGLACLTSCQAEAPASSGKAPPSTEPASDVMETSPPVTADAPAGEVVDLPSTWKEPGQAVIDIVDAPPTPVVSFSPDGTTFLVMGYPAQPDLSVLAEPLLRIAGTRIHPGRSHRQRTSYYDSLKLGTVDKPDLVALDVPGPRLLDADWSPDGKRVALTTAADEGVELWVLDVESKTVSRVGDRHVNATLSGAVTWMPDGKRLLVRTIDPQRGAEPLPPPVPPGPTVLESSGRSAQNRTYQDLITDRLQEKQFEYFFTSRLTIVDAGSGETTELGEPGVYARMDASPDGRWILATELRPPWSYRVPWWGFAHHEWAIPIDGGEPVLLADEPAAETVPIGGVEPGPRDFEWLPTEPASLMYVEARDGGDPKKEVEFRDEIFIKEAPFTDASTLARTTHRMSRIAWLADGQRYMLTEYDRDRRWVTTHLRRRDDPTSDKVIDDRSVSDRYADPGSPIYEWRPDGTAVVRTDGDFIYLSGPGASPTGDHPFVDKVSLADESRERLFESPKGEYTRFADFAGSPERLVLRTESPTEPPNYVLLEDGKRTRLTSFPHPHPELSGIGKQLLTYKRKDGVPLSGTLYLPADHEEGDRHPLIIWAYPREYTDKKMAGQVRATPTRFSRLRSTSPLMYLTQGYAVLDGAEMPIVGNPETMNDNLLPQMVDAAKAAIDAVDELGVIDRDKVVISGHSYGAFMTANLLAHSDLFAAGIARSGAYNRSLTPFGFQSERRTLWEATPTYVKVSPLFAADQINEPLLMIHGEVDSNSGTFPIQSKRLFHALEGLGGTTRLVLLPHESHGYRSRQAVLHVLAEQFKWIETHVATPEPTETPEPAEED